MDALLEFQGVDMRGKIQAGKTDAIAERYVENWLPGGCAAFGLCAQDSRPLDRDLI